MGDATAMDSLVDTLRLQIELLVAQVKEKDEQMIRKDQQLQLLINALAERDQREKQLNNNNNSNNKGGNDEEPLGIEKHQLQENGENKEVGAEGTPSPPQQRHQTNEENNNITPTNSSSPPTTAHNKMHNDVAGSVAAEATLTVPSSSAPPLLGGNRSRSRSNSSAPSYKWKPPLSREAIGKMSKLQASSSNSSKPAFITTDERLERMEKKLANMEDLLIGLVKQQQQTSQQTDKAGASNSENKGSSSGQIQTTQGNVATSTASSLVKNVKKGAKKVFPLNLILLLSCPKRSIQDHQSLSHSLTHNADAYTSLPCIDTCDYSEAFHL